MSIETQRAETPTVCPEPFYGTYYIGGILFVYLFFLVFYILWRKLCG